MWGFIDRLLDGVQIDGQRYDQVALIKMLTKPGGK